MHQNSPNAREVRKDRIEGLAERLKKLRAERRLTQREVAGQIGVAANSYATWEQNEGTPHLLHLIDLAELFGVTLDELAGRSPSGSYSHVMQAYGFEWRFAESLLTRLDSYAVALWNALLKGGRVEDLVEKYKFTRPEELDDHLLKLTLDGLVEITQVARNEDLERGVRAAYRPLLQQVRVVNMHHIDPKSELLRQILVGYAAKAYFLDVVRPGFSVGLCGGRTVGWMVQAFRHDEGPFINLHPVAVSPILELASISANNLVAALARRLSGQVRASQLPFYPDAAVHNPTKMVTESVLNDAATVDVLFMGAGGPGKGALALDIEDQRHNYLRSAGIEADHIVYGGGVQGNLMYYLLNEYGEQPEDFREQNNQMVCSIGLESLRTLVNRGRLVVVMAQGGKKAQIIRAALRKNYANVLVIDDELASALIALR